MKWLIRFFVLALIAYLGMTSLLYVTQRSLQYPASARVTDVIEAQLEGFEDIRLETSDGETLRGFWKPPEAGRALILYFHGNGGNLWNRRDRVRALAQDGRGVLIVSYRSYSGSTGSPTEAGLHEDARTAYNFAIREHDPALLLVYGESLGTGIAVRLAAENPVAALVLDAPYTSTADVAAIRYPFIPISILMHDQYRSIDIIDQVKAPILIMHGDADIIIPFSQGQALYAAAPQPKRFMAFPGNGHTSLLENGGLDLVRALLTGVEEGDAIAALAALPQ
jgi:fermentation-respiration switch protein FrsA (DUF1100 family)